MDRTVCEMCVFCAKHTISTYIQMSTNTDTDQNHICINVHMFVDRSDSSCFVEIKRGEMYVSYELLRVLLFFFSLPLQFNTRNVQISLLLWWKIAHFHTPRSNNYDLLIFFSTCSKKKSKKIVHKVGFVNHLQHDFIVTKMNAHKHVEITCQWTKRKKNRYGMS